MKKKIIRRTSRAFLYMAILGFIFLINSCSNKATSSSDDNGAKPQSMIPDAPKDDGQGVGRFKNVAVGTLDEKMATQGKLVFEAKCTACHNTTAIKKVGPGLKDVTQRRQPAWILNQITNPAEMIQKDPTAKELLGQYLTQMTFQDVTDDQARQILEFLRQNDNTGNEEAKK